MLLSALLGKKTVGGDGTELGKVTGIAYDKSQKTGAVCTDGGVFAFERFSIDGELTLYAPWKFSGTALFTGTPIYDASAKYAGKIADIELNKNLKPTKIISDGGLTVTRGRIAAAGDIVLLRAQNAKKRKKQQLPREQNVAAAAPDNTVKRVRSDGGRRTNRRYGDFSFLIGKCVDKNITNFQNETMIKRGETVTADILRQAKISGKLIELCLHVK